MKKVFEFNKNSNAINNFKYVYSPICTEFKAFAQTENSLKNGYCESLEYDYVSIVTREKYRTGVRFNTKCSFEKFGAPLLVFTDDITTDDSGNEIYGLHFEVVAYEGGLNIWHIVPYPERVSRPIKPTKIAFAEFEIKAGDICDITVEILGKTIIATINGVTVKVENDDVPEQFHIGLTACEGINEFYSFEVEE